VALNNARERARDSRRVSDIRQIQTALELYFNANDEYLGQATEANVTGIESDLISYMNPIPSNPTPDDCGSTVWGGVYLYEAAASNASTYTLKYCLGNETGNIPGGAVQTATPTSIY
jgi:type II secretory pathway pseudopilin PulG